MLAGTIYFSEDVTPPLPVLFRAVSLLPFAGPKLNRITRDPVTRVALCKWRSVGCSAVTTGCRNSLRPRLLLLSRGILTTLRVPESGWFLLPSSVALCRNEKTKLSASKDWKHLLTSVCLSLGKGAIGWEEQILLWPCSYLKEKF